MNTERIPAKKVMEPGMSLNDIDNIWDYIDMYVEEETPNAPEICLDDEDDFDNDWRSDYYDAFEDDPEAEWGRKW